MTDVPAVRPVPVELLTFAELAALEVLSGRPLPILRALGVDAVEADSALALAGFTSLEARRFVGETPDGLGLIDPLAQLVATLSLDAASVAVMVDLGDHVELSWLVSGEACVAQIDAARRGIYAVSLHDGHDVAASVAGSAHELLRRHDGARVALQGLVAGVPVGEAAVLVGVEGEAVVVELGDRRVAVAAVDLAARLSRLLAGAVTASAAPAGAGG